MVLNLTIQISQYYRTIYFCVFVYLFVCLVCSFEWDWPHAYSGEPSCDCDRAPGRQHSPTIPPPVPRHHRTGTHPTAKQQRSAFQHTSRAPCLHGQEQRHTGVPPVHGCTSEDCTTASWSSRSSHPAAEWPHVHAEITLPVFRIMSQYCYISLKYNYTSKIFYLVYNFHISMGRLFLIFKLFFLILIFLFYFCCTIMYKCFLLQPMFNCYDCKLYTMVIIFSTPVTSEADLQKHKREAGGGNGGQILATRW